MDRFDQHAGPFERAAPCGLEGAPVAGKGDQQRAVRMRHGRQRLEFGNRHPARLAARNAQVDQGLVAEQRHPGKFRLGARPVEMLGDRENLGGR